MTARGSATRIERVLTPRRSGNLEDGDSSEQLDCPAVDASRAQFASVQVPASTCD